MGREALLADLERVFGPERVLSEPAELLTYECDGHTTDRGAPEVVVLPETTEEVRQAVRIANLNGVPFLPRGAGTGLSGGAVATRGGLLIALTRMNRILDVDLASRTAVVQPGVVNLHLTNRILADGYHYAPDPSSQAACTIGGNVAENSGGPHTLKYGVTVNHVLGLTVVLPDGEVVQLGSRAGGGPGLDLTGLFTGSEGTLGIATEIVVRLTRNPKAVRTFLAVYDSVDAASESVSAIIRAGIVPAAIELIDRLSIQAVEAHMKVGYPEDAEAVLLVEIDGAELSIGPLAEQVLAICREHGAREVRTAADEAERARLWRGRKLALGAVGKIAKAFYTHDGVVPRSKLPEALRLIRAVAGRRGLRVANICHAGDGNLHPLVLFDPDDPEEAKSAKEAGEEILGICLDLGGSLTGEHGVGLEKREMLGRLFSEDDLDQMLRVRRVFDPDGRANPDKIFPLGASCGELAAARASKTGGWV